jgi:hypothetical protein
MLPGTNKNFADFMDSPWIREQVETHLLWGNYKQKHFYLLFLIAYYILCNMLILNAVGITPVLEVLDTRGIVLCGAMLMGILFGNYSTNALFWGITKFMFLLLCPMIILMGCINFLRNEPEDIEFIITGVLLLPFPEFIQRWVKYQKYITLIRLTILIPTWSYMIKSGS